MGVSMRDGVADVRAGIEVSVCSGALDVSRGADSCGGVAAWVRAGVASGATYTLASGPKVWDSEEGCNPAAATGAEAVCVDEVAGANSVLSSAGALTGVVIRCGVVERAGAVSRASCGTRLGA